MSDKTIQLIETYHKDYPLRRGIPREELKSRIKTYRSAPSMLSSTNLSLNSLITDHAAFLAKPGHEIRFNAEEQAKVQTLMRKFEAHPFSPPGIKECQSVTGEEVVNALIERKELVAVSAEVVFRKEDYDFMEAAIRKTITKNGKISLAETRDLFQTSRKYAQALLEHLDALGITIRDGDFRKIKKQ